MNTYSLQRRGNLLSDCLKVLLSFFALFFCFLVSGTSQVSADTISDKPQTIDIVAKFSISQTDQKTLDLIQKIDDEDPSVTTSRNGDVLRIDTIRSNASSESLELQKSVSPITTRNVKTVDFGAFVENMDNMNGESAVPNGSPMDGLTRKSYQGQKDGQKVAVGTHVHCNRFNGTNADHKYWSKTHARAYTDFYHSDCDYHAIAYGCSSIGKMSKCDGLNKKGKGVKDCSSYSGGKAHKNWSKTAWYRN